MYVYCMGHHLEPLAQHPQVVGSTLALNFFGFHFGTLLTCLSESIYLSIYLFIHLNLRVFSCVTFE